MQGLVNEVRTYFVLMNEDNISSNTNLLAMSSSDLPTYSPVSLS